MTEREIARMTEREIAGMTEREIAGMTERETAGMTERKTVGMTEGLAVEETDGMEGGMTERTAGRLVKRTVMTVLGTVFTAAGVALIRKIAWGVDPFTCLIGGLEKVSGLSYGVLLAVVLSVMLVITFVLNRHYIGLATFITLFLQGSMVDLLEKWIVSRYFTSPGLFQKILMMAAALFFLCFGASLYITSDLGVSAYDALSLILSERRGWKYRFCRILTDGLCVAAGAVMGGNAGILTIVTACCMGPLVSWMNEHWSEPILRG